MITADRLKTLTSFTSHALSQALHHSGHAGVKLKAAQFLGITEGGEFCYGVTFADGVSKGRLAEGKVFLTYDATAGKVTANY